MKISCHRIGSILLMVVVLAASSGCTKSARAKRMLKAANADFNAENYDNAEVEYKNVLRLSAMNPAAIGQMGRLYAKEGRLSEAHMYLTKGVELQPNSLALQLALGQVDGAIHDPADAAKISMRILSAFPTNEEALLLLVDNVGNSQELRQHLESMPHAEENPGYHTALGILSLRQKKFVDAENELRVAVAANPQSSEAYFAQAELYGSQKKIREAAESFQKASEVAPLRSPIRSRYAEYLIQTGSIEEGRKILREMTEKAPDYIPGWVGLMNLAMSEKKFDDAAKLTDTVLSRDANNYDALIAKGNISLVRGDAANAAANFEHMASIWKKVPPVKYGLAMAYLMNHDKARSMAQLKEAVELDPGYAQATMVLGQLYIRNGNPALAVDLLNKFNKRVPGVGQAYLLLADAYMAEQKPDSAIAIYLDLSHSLPKNPQIPMLMGIVLAGQHKDAEARAAFEKSIKLAPDYMPAVQQLISLDVAEHRYADATALAQQQIDKHPQAAELWEVQAKIDLEQTNMARAESNLLKAIELNPNLPSPYLLLAKVYVHSDKYQEALKKLNALVDRTNDAAAYLQIGALHEQLKEFEAARDAYEKVLTINSNSSPALNDLAYIYAVQLNKIDRAYELAQRARELQPQNPSVGDTLGWILLKKGDYVHALALLEDSAEKKPADPEIQYHLGLVHYMLDEEDAARVSLQQAVASPQDYPNKDDARKRLAVLNMDVAKAGPAVLADFQKALADDPNDPVLLNRVGALQEREGAAEKAAATYETARKLNPDSIQLLTKLARLYALQLNQPEKALSLATTGHQVAPDNADVSAVLGHLVFRTGDYVRAMSLLENAADQLPNQPQLLYDLAWAYYAVGRIDDAEKTMRKLLSVDAGFAENADAKRFLALVDAFTSTSQVQTAAGQAQKILQADAKYVPAIMISGAAEEISGNFQAARDDYKKALDVFPLFVPASRQLAILDAKHFQEDGANYALAEKARTAYPDDPEVAGSLGILSYFQAKYSRSAQLLQESISKGKSDGELYFCLGMDYYQLKENKESRQALKQALTMNIPDKQAAEAKQRLAELK